MATTPLSLKKRTCLCAVFGAGMAWLNVGQAGVPPHALVNSSNTPHMSTSAPGLAASIRLLDPSPPAATRSKTTEAAEVGKVAAAMQESRAPHPVDGWLAVDESRLSDMRGGFDTDTGLKISVGVQRAVYVNGNLSTTTSFNIPDVGQLTGEQARLLSTTSGTVNLIQNGSGNDFQPGAIPQAATATVIQNTLDNQDIKSLTVIDATANSLGMLKNINFQSSLQDAMQNSLGSR